MNDNREKTLQELVARNPEFKPIFQQLAKRKTHRQFTDVYNLSNAMKDSVKNKSEREKLTETMVRLFRDLANLEIGQMVSEPGTRPRFMWNYETKSVGEAAIQNGTLRSVPKPHHPDPSSSVGQNGQKRDRILLGDGREVYIEAPDSLTQEDMERITIFLSWRVSGAPKST